MKRRSKGDAGADGGFDGSGIAFGRSALIREAPDTWAGAEAQSWHARDGAVRIPNPFAKSEAVSSLCWFVYGDSPPASRPPIAFALDPDGVSCLLLRHPRPSAALRHCRPARRRRVGNAKQKMPRRRPGIRHRNRRRHNIGHRQFLLSPPERLTCWRFDDDARNVKTLDKVRPMRDEARKFCPRTMNGTTADDQDPYRDRYLRPH